MIPVAGLARQAGCHMNDVGGHEQDTPPICTAAIASAASAERVRLMAFDMIPSVLSSNQEEGD
jgi:hypothetical protein